MQRQNILVHVSGYFPPFHVKTEGAEVETGGWVSAHNYTHVDRRDSRSLHQDAIVTSHMNHNTMLRCTVQYVFTYTDRKYHAVV